MRRAMRGGFTIRDLLMLTFVIAALSFCLIPWNYGTREASRRMMCSNNLKQLALAMHNYRDTQNHFPTPTLPNDWLAGNHHGSGRMFNGVIELLPYLEQESLYNEITLAVGKAHTYLPPPDDKTFVPWQKTPQGLNCPSASEGSEDLGKVNYAFSIGDVAVGINDLAPITSSGQLGPRGAFGPGLTTHFRDITDGTSNTIMFAEIGTASGRQVIGQYAVRVPASVLDDPQSCFLLLDDAKPKNNKNRTYRSQVPRHERGRGYCWADGRAGAGLVNTILPPNGPSCAVGGSIGVDGYYSAGSEHPGGVLVALVDASVRFISEQIDTGDLTQASPHQTQVRFEPAASPYGVWGALGSRAGSEKDHDY